MKNYYLAVDKTLFELNLNPLEILILAQVEEFQRNKCVCYLTDEGLAASFGVSERTISRAITHLSELQLLKKETKTENSKRIRALKSQRDNLTASAQ